MAYPVLHKGEPGQAYNIGSGREQTNLEVVHQILADLKKPADLIRSVKDRPGHDRRYALDCRKITGLGFTPRYSFIDALRETTSWYQENPGWWQKIKSGEFQKYYRKMYADRS